MIVSSIRTDKIVPGMLSLNDFLDRYLGGVEDKSVVAIASKVVSICEGNVIAADKTDKEQLAIREAERYLPADTSKYHHHFTISHGTLLGMGGIDESNGGGFYVMLPKNPQASANKIRRYLTRKLQIKNLGVIITDSASVPLRLGAVGVCLGYSGFEPVKDYRGQPDLFGRPFKISQASIAAGLAAASVLVMGEGAEQTPLAIFEDLQFIDFKNSDPSAAELKTVNMTLENDLFAPFFQNAGWQRGGQTKT